MNSTNKDIKIKKHNQMNCIYEPSLKTITVKYNSFYLISVGMTTSATFLPDRYQHIVHIMVFIYMQIMSPSLIGGPAEV